MAASVDVAVVGAGLAGSTAAWRARELGASVLHLERSRRRPSWSNSMISGGALHAVLRDPATPPDELVRLAEEVTEGRTRSDVVRAWAANATRTIAWLESHGAQLSSDPSMPHRGKVFAPVRETVPGIRSRGFGLPLWLAHAAPELERLGGRRWQPARARGLERADSVWRLDVETLQGSRVRARSVVLADGGFQANPALLRSYLGTDKVRLRAAGTSTGDCLEMSLAVGGQAWEMRSFYCHLLAGEALKRDDLWPYPILDGLAADGAVVGPDGRRLVSAGRVGSQPPTPWPGQLIHLAVG